MLVEGTVSIDRSSDVANYIALAERALASGNCREAVDYAKRALEIEHKNVDAWLCRARAVRGLSSIIDPLAGEMIHCFSSAIDLTSEDQRPALRERCGAELNAAGEQCMAQTPNRIFDRRASYLQLINLFQWSYHWSPQRRPLNNIEHLAMHMVTFVSGAAKKETKQLLSETRAEIEKVTR
ncbi:hypothetical protein [Nocardioides sp. MH1]|uniref:hypothetical protein n=1 Tax=Nocardioides sp. MH1 TaxID=3242490 RepID=UPI003522646A